MKFNQRKERKKAIAVVTIMMLTTSLLGTTLPAVTMAQGVEKQPVASVKASNVQAKMSLDTPVLTVVKGKEVGELINKMGLHAMVTLPNGKTVDVGWFAKYNADDYNYNKVGTYNVKFTLNYTPDSDPNTTYVGSIIGKINVVEASKPIINVKPATVYQGDVFKISNWASAYDKEDGNLTNKIGVFGKYDKPFNTNEVGTFDVIYAVQDSDLNYVEVKSTITVLPKEQVNQKPVLTVPSKTTIKVGTAFDPMKGVTATDKEDGNITKNIKVVTNNVDVNKEGTYTVGYSVVDSKGLKTEATQQVVVTNSEVALFSDVPTTHWAFKEINDLANKKIINGYLNGTYKPAQSIRRDHVALLLSRSLDLKPVEKAKDFKDVPKNSPYYKAIQELQMAGIFDGDSQGKFNPTTNLTRAEMAKVMVEAFDIPASNKELTFKDVPKDSWSYKYIQSLSASGITQGKNDKEFDPNGEVNRAQYAVFLYRAMNQ